MFLRFFTLLIVFIPYSSASELARLDTFEVENYFNSKTLIHLFITENCSVCSQQLKILENCLSKDQVSVYMEGSNEEHLRKIIKRKKIPFKVYHLNSKVKENLLFNNQSPSITFIDSGKFKNTIGLKNCPEIQSLIKADNLNPRK